MIVSNEFLRQQRETCGVDFFTTKCGSLQKAQSVKASLSKIKGTNKKQRR